MSSLPEQGSDKPSQAKRNSCTDTYTSPDMQAKRRAPISQNRPREPNSGKHPQESPARHGRPTFLRKPTSLVNRHPLPQDRRPGWPAPRHAQAPAPGLASAQGRPGTSARAPAPRHAHAAAPRPQRPGWPAPRHARAGHF